MAVELRRRRQREWGLRTKRREGRRARPRLTAPRHLRAVVINDIFLAHKDPPDVELHRVYNYGNTPVRTEWMHPKRMIRRR